MHPDRSSRGRRPASRRKTGSSCGAGTPAPEFRKTSAAQHEFTTKRRGELAELAFALKAARLGFGVSRPWGDSERYDFILDADDLHSLPPTPLFPSVIPIGAVRRAKRTAPRGTTHPPVPPAATKGISTKTSRLWRVQVKGSTQIINRLYHVNSCRHVNKRAVPYTAAEIDFFAAYIIPEDTWYILPVEQVVDRTSLLFRRKRDRKPGLYDAYREAWSLLRRSRS